MVAYSFKARFAAPILAGLKNQTIRAERRGRSRHARPGDMVQLFTGMRTRQCHRLGEAPCLGLDRVRNELPAPRKRPEILIFGYDGDLLSRAVEPCGLDGFEYFDDLDAFWRSTCPGVDTVHGVLIRWRPLAAASALDSAGTA